ncbi:MAG: hypothetical protein WCC26_17785 [Terracidiphilus sp.]
MQRLLCRIRAHPIRSAALLGALIGFLNALATEINAILHKSSSSVVYLLLPPSSYGRTASESSLAASAFILFIEIAASALSYALLLTIPVALYVGLRRLFLRRKT